MLLNYILIALAFLALAGVIFEEVIHINKAKITLLFGTLSWILLFVFAATGADRQLIDHSLRENLADISSLWLFLVAAMTFVAYLNKKGLIANLLHRAMPESISERKLLFFTAIFSFIFSSLADNITATLVSIALILSLSLPPNKTIRFAVLVVFAVNSGGVSLITGDVTTLMIFLADKVSILNLLWLSLPSFTAVMALTLMMSIGMNGKVRIKQQKLEIRKIDYAIAAIFLCTILFTIVGNVLFEIPPVLSFLAGLSIMFIVARLCNDDDEHDPIMEYIRYIEFDTLLFFLGILLLVGMLEQIHALDFLVTLYQYVPPLYANYIMGITSATVDNVPLTAALLKTGIEMDLASWLGLTYAVGVGGSLLVIGSAAGIVTMSKVPGLSFARYAKYGLLLLLAYTLGYVLVIGLGQVI
ncbi:sodium:proton antiporter NhaD [Paraglaciecola arctica]|uniref:Citrate transporter n=1 Tax=Paraglaciecola arctica BSs20135 TaxID=493475 RepID=K6Z7Z3_9ALTE|nr:sodium:proton antiporter NhaD [Paraglaciecola arctica]GAC19570.1 citrate transporter [Paraglaciecola arctica BSs20135]|tara:strand:+ start:4567 stop:5811 length:1245 start_codon:yes stop_codon:yes gene_type:complete